MQANCHPVEVLVDAVRRSAAMVALLGGLVGELDAVHRLDHEGVQRPDVLVLLYGTWVDRSARAAKLALDAGVEERQVRLEEHHGRGIATVLRGVLDDVRGLLRDGLGPEFEGRAGELLTSVEARLPGLVGARLRELAAAEGDRR